MPAPTGPSPFSRPRMPSVGGEAVVDVHRRERPPAADRVSHPALGTGREARLVLRCTSYTTVAILAAWAMAARSRRSAQGSDPGAERGGPWLGAGHMLYFLTGAVGNALNEALVSRDRDALLQVHRAQHLTYGIAMVAIAGGIRASVRLPARSAAAPAPAPAPAARFSDIG